MKNPAKIFHPITRINLYLWLVLAVSVFAWAPLLTPAYFLNAHDARHSIFFLVEFDQTFRDGFLWPRWSPDFAFGYGYPLFNLYAPLAFYAAELLHLLGLGFAASIKTMYVLATIGAGLSMYGFVAYLFGRRAGFLAAVVYMYAPFHLVEIFVRSAYAEFVALALIPLLFWAFTRLVDRPSPRRAAAAGLVYGVLALTHHTSFFTFTPFLVVYILFLLAAKAGQQPKAFLGRAFYAAGAGLSGLMLAAIYLVPVVAETRFIKVEQWTSGSYNYLQHFVYFSQFLSPEWGYGYAGPGLNDDFSFQLGIVITGLAIFAGVSGLTRRFPRRGVALFFLLSTVVAILLMTPPAGPVWQTIPIAALVQFPWRLLGLVAFTLAVAAGSLPARGKPSYRNPAFAGSTPSALYLLAMVVILASFAYTRPQYTDIPPWAETPLAVVNWDRASIVDRVGMVSVTEEQPQTSPMEPQYLHGDPLTVAGIIRGQGAVDTLHHGGGSDTVRVTAQTPVTLQFYTYDYPGWRVTLNGRRLAHRPQPPYGLITVDVPAGEHILHLRMGSTPPRMLGAILSGLAVVALAALYFWPALTIFKSRFTITHR